MDQTPSGSQAPTELPVLPHRIDISATRTPLGGPMTRYSASRLAQDPLTWHMQYWLALGTVGMLRGEDEALMGFRIEMEHDKMYTEQKARFRALWNQYRRLHVEACQQHWEEMTVDSEEAKWYIRDIDAMLVDKVQKARQYLVRQEMRMLAALQATRFDLAQVLYDGLVKIYAKLQEEATRDAAREAEARNRLPNGVNGVHSQGGQGPEAMEAEPVVNGHVSDDE